MNFKLTTLTGIIATIIFASGCGQSQSTSANFALNSFYINLQNQIQDPTFNLSDQLFAEDTQDLNNRSGENILFKPNGRSVNLSYGDLQSGVLGLTICSFRFSDNGQNSSCSISINKTINPDQATSYSEKSRKTTIFLGVLRHEIGHAFGLGHIKDDPNNVMYPYFRDEQMDEPNVEKFITNLNNFRQNGPASGLPTIDVK